VPEIGETLDAPAIPESASHLACATGPAQFDACFDVLIGGVTYKVTFDEQSRKVTSVATSDLKFKTLDGHKIGDSIEFPRSMLEVSPYWYVYGPDTADGWRPTVGFDYGNGSGLLPGVPTGDPVNASIFRFSKSSVSPSDRPRLPSSKTQVVILGTGTPIINPDRSGPSVAVVVNGSAYLVDFGPGVVRRAAAAAREKHIDALIPRNLKVVFATHLHSDHTAGLSDLYLTPAVEGRPGALELYGPPGIADMARHIQAAYVKDVDIRTEGLEHGNRAAYKINAHEIKPGLIYQDSNVKVTAFAVAHGTWDFSYGYRFDTADRSIVISGDTAPTPAIATACHGCDLLLHEVYSTAWFQQRTPAWQKYHSTFHTSTTALAEIANAAKPKQLVLYHQLFRPEDDVDKVLIDEIRKAGFTGPVASAHDLDIF
jgi:ribonuclease BN (tRNA processing enzyme)